jgi:hypothetical protein
MHYDREINQTDRLARQTIRQNDERLTVHSGNHELSSSATTARGEVAVGSLLVFLVFVNAFASNHSLAISELADDFIPASKVAVSGLPSTMENVRSNSAPVDVHVSQEIETALISAPDALAIFLADDDADRGHSKVIKSPRGASPPYGQRRDVRNIDGLMSQKFNPYQTRVAIGNSVTRDSCTSSKLPQSSTNINVSLSTSGRPTVTRVANGPARDPKQAGCMVRALRTALVKPFDGAAARTDRTIGVP